MAPRRHESIVPLSHDHREALALAFRLHNPSPPGPATTVTPPSTPSSRAAEVIAFFAGHLDGHFRAEEEVLFPALAAHLAADAPTSVLLRELIDEHRRMAALRDRIAAVLTAHADPGDELLRDPLRSFADALERHVRREERELFGEFSALVGDDEARGLGPRIRRILDARPALAGRVPARLAR